MLRSRAPYEPPTGTVEPSYGKFEITPESKGASGNGAAMPDGVPNLGADDTAAFNLAAAEINARPDGGILRCGPRRYMLDMPALSQLIFSGSNLEIIGVPGQTIFDFSRSVGWHNGAPGMDGVVVPDGLICASGRKYGGDSMVVETGTYSSSVGVVACKMSELVTFDAGVTLSFTATSGTGAFASLSGASFTTVTATRTVVTNASTASGSVLPFASTSGMYVGQAVAGTNIAASTYITAVTSTTITLSNAITGTVASAASLSITPGYTLVFVATAGLGASTITGGTVQVLSDGYRLQADTIYSPGRICDITAGARSGTTITVTVPTGHGIVMGNLLYSVGEPTITGDDVDEGDDGGIFLSSQDCFYTVGSRAVGRSTPVQVTGVTATTVTWEYAGSLVGQDTVMITAGLPGLQHASDCAKVKDSSVFHLQQRVMIASLRERGRDNEHCNIGEWQVIKALLPGNILRFGSDVHETYATADYGRIFAVDLLDNITIDGITFVGKGHNPDTYYDPNPLDISPGTIQRGDTCIKLAYVQNLNIRNCHFVDMDFQSINVTYCLRGHVYKNIIEIDRRDEAGAFTRAVDIQYGVNYGQCIDDFVIEQNRVYGGRHAFVQGGSSSQLEFGVARNIRIINNYCSQQWLEAMSTHQGASEILFGWNTIIGARGGINPRYCSKVRIIGNLIRCKENGIVLINDLLDGIITDNDIEAGSYPLWMKLIDNPTAAVQTSGLTSAAGKLSGPTPAGPGLKVRGNIFRGGRNGMYLVDVTPGLLIRGLEIDDNTFIGSRKAALNIRVGDPTEAADGFTGSISLNRFYDNCTEGTEYQARISNARHIMFQGNQWEGTSAFGYAFLFEGAGTDAIDFTGTRVASTLYGTAIFHPSTTGTGHRTDMFTREDVTIASGVAAIKFHTTDHILLRGEGTAADDLTSITGCRPDQQFVLSNPFGAAAITVKHGTGFELDGNADKLLDSALDRMQVMWSSSASKIVQTATLMNHA